MVFIYVIQWYARSKKLRHDFNFTYHFSAFQRISHQDPKPRKKEFNHRIQGWKGPQGSSGSNFLSIKHYLGKRDQHLNQVDLQTVWCQGRYHIPVEIISMADCSHCEKISSRVQSEYPQVHLLPTLPHLLHVTPCKKGNSIFFVSTS